MFTENIIAYLAKQTIKKKKLVPNKCKITIANKEKTKDMYLTIDYDGKRYWNIFHYWKIWFDKYILTTKLRKLRFIKKNITYKDE